MGFSEFFSRAILCEDENNSPRILFNFLKLQYHTASIYYLNYFVAHNKRGLIWTTGQMLHLSLENFHSPGGQRSICSTR
ncbi:hypothetical protein VULLAG_LOCUS17203 [Vulpes lagopus]